MSEYSENIRRIAVAETFYSIQGEGPSMGVPAVFLRLAGCNLLCSKPNGWTCDSIEVWKRGKWFEFDKVLEPTFIKRLREGAHLVITGGEPMLQERSIIGFIHWLRLHGAKPFIEIETNGTLMPSNTLCDLVDQWNVSFKLSSAGETYAKRINEAALAKFNTLLNVTFKIVISDEGDILELINDFGQLISRKKIMLMPAGATQEELNATRRVVVEAAKEHGWRYCDRLHIVIWNQKTGV